MGYGQDRGAEPPDNRYPVRFEDGDTDRHVSPEDKVFEPNLFFGDED